LKGKLHIKSAKSAPEDYMTILTSSNTTDSFFVYLIVNMGQNKKQYVSRSRVVTSSEDLDDNGILLTSESDFDLFFWNTVVFRCGREVTLRKKNVNSK
jgi:hypothetical protein